MDTVIFVADFIVYAFVGVFLSDAKCMGGEYFKRIMKSDLRLIILCICAII